MAPNFDPDPFVIVPDTKNLVFDPKMTKMGRNQKSPKNTPKILKKHMEVGGRGEAL